MTQAARDHIDQAHQAIRAAVDSTNEPGRHTVADTFAMTDGLGRLAWVLDQCFSNLARNLDHRLEANQLRHPSGVDPVESVVDAMAKLRTASHQIAFTAQLLDQAHHELGDIADFAALLGDPQIEDETR